jgi:hypothetical protein
LASTDARPIPIKNTAFRAVFPILDADGDLVTGAAGLDSEVSKDQGTFADCTNEATEIATSSGMYYLDLTSTEMNADCVAVIVKTSTTGAKTTVLVLYPEETGDINVDVTAFGGTAGTFASGRPEVDANLISIDGQVTSGNNATLNLKQLNIVNSAGSALVASSTGSNGHGIAASGNGSGEGISATGGATGNGMECVGGATSGSGVAVSASGSGSSAMSISKFTNAGTGLSILGNQTGNGVTITGGQDGLGMAIAAGSGSGDALRLTAGTTGGDGLDITAPNGNGIRVSVTSGSGHGATFTGRTAGIHAAGGSAASGHGISAVGGATGHGISAAGGSTSGDGINASVTGASNFGLNATLADGMITAAAIATDAIDSDALAASAVTEIQSGLSTLDAAGVRTAVGLASANLDTQLGAIDDFLDTEVAAILAAVDTEVAAIKAKTDNLPDGIAKNTALSAFSFLMVDSSDHVTPKTGLTVTGQRSIDGGAFANCTNNASIAEIGTSGVYKVDLSAADLNGDVITLKFTATGADATVIVIKTEA